MGKIMFRTATSADGVFSGLRHAIPYFRRKDSSEKERLREFTTRVVLRQEFGKLLSESNERITQLRFRQKVFSSELCARLKRHNITNEDIYSFSQQMLPGNFTPYLKQADFDERANLFFGALITACPIVCKIGPLIKSPYTSRKYLAERLIDPTHGIGEVIHPEENSAGIQEQDSQVGKTEVRKAKTSFFDRFVDGNANRKINY